MRRALLAAALAAVLYPGAAQAEERTVALISGGDSHPVFDTSSADGSRAFYRTTARVVAEDVDDQFDVYERSGGATTLLSVGPNGGNGSFGVVFNGASSDGTRVFFSTAEQLTTEDTDVAMDVYDRADGRTTLVSTGQHDAGVLDNADFDFASADGTRVLFTTKVPLVAADDDTERDLYVRAAGETRLVSVGRVGANDPAPALFGGATPDARHVFFETEGSLLTTDTDSKLDVYRRANGQTTHVSTGPDGGNAAIPARFVDVSDDGERIFFETNESLVSGDRDEQSDVYERAESSTTRVTTGPDGGNGADLPALRHVSADGSRVVFETREQMTVDDGDGAMDVYTRANGVTTLASPGPGVVDVSFSGASADGTRVWMETAARLTAADGDPRLDVYEWTDGKTTLVSDGSAAVNAFFAAGSEDGQRVFFRTPEGLVAEDVDGTDDVYERAGGTTTLVSRGANTVFAGLSRDGRSLFFQVRDALVPEDTDDEADIYAARVVDPPADPGPAVESEPEPGPPPPAPDITAPVLSDVSLTRARFRTRGRRAGTTIRYRLSEDATLTVAVRRLRRGRGALARGSIRAAAAAGPGALPFRGRVGGRRLARGRYRATLRAVDAAGNASEGVSVRFRVV